VWCGQPYKDVCSAIDAGVVVVAVGTIDVVLRARSEFAMHSETLRVLHRARDISASGNAVLIEWHVQMVFR